MNLLTEVAFIRTCLRIVVLSLLAALATGCGGRSRPSSPPPKASCTPSSKPEFAYVLSGATTAWGNGTISVFTVDSCTGVLTATTPSAIATGSDPEEIVVDPLGRFVYSANLVSNASDLATISMYAINPTTGVLIPTTPATVGTGFLPQGIGIDPAGRFVYTANSDDNTVSMFAIDQTTGVLAPTTPPSVAAGWSPLSITVHPSGQFAYAANQNDGTVSMYTVNQSTGVLSPTTPPTVSAGSSPFGVTIDPSGKFAYVPDADNPNNFVWEYTIDPSTGVLSPTAGIAAIAGNSPTSVAVDPSGKFAYVVNRMANSVSAFGIDGNTGNLSPIATVATEQQPWQLTVDPSGKFVYVGNENSESVSIYSINSDGTLTPAGTAAVPGPAFTIGVVVKPKG